MELYVQKKSEIFPISYRFHKTIYIYIYIFEEVECYPRWRFVDLAALVPRLLWKRYSGHSETVKLSEDEAKMSPSVCYLMDFSTLDIHGYTM